MIFIIEKSIGYCGRISFNYIFRVGGYKDNFMGSGREIEWIGDGVCKYGDRIGKERYLDIRK